MRSGSELWPRAALTGLLAATAVLDLWDLGASGWANSYYAAAAQAGSQSWKAFLFGASDAAGSISVDKPPLAVWPMALSVRLFGLSSWSVLVPQALAGVASVGLLYATVRRGSGSAAAGLIAGAVLATTPVAALMFRYDNPDALLVLVLVGSVYATLRAVDGRNAVWWLVLAGALVGLGFMAKMLQAFLVLPGLGLAYLLEGRPPWRRRVMHLVAAVCATVASAGWWVALVELWPPSRRPYVGGSAHNSVLELTFGYNGFGRLSGNESGSVGRSPNGTTESPWGPTGPLRMFDGHVGGQVAWLLPAAVVLLVAGLLVTRGAPRGDAGRASLLAWGGWLLVTALTFSFMAGIFHPYYTVALAPAVGAVVGIGTTLLWRQRDRVAATLTMATVVAATAAVAFVLLDRTPTYHPWLRWLVVWLGVGSAIVLALLPYLTRPAALVAGSAGLLAALLAPLAYSLTTAADPHSGSVPSAGPGPGTTSGTTSGTTASGLVGFPAFGGARGLFDARPPSARVTAYLRRDASSYTWVAATVGSTAAAALQLATGGAVMPVGGYNATDPAPTLAEFQRQVAERRIHYFVGPVAGGPTGIERVPPGTEAAAVSRWVAQHYLGRQVGEAVVFDLSGRAPQP
jgi:4-amino-4-deoxy-L-arabinose transferase-like glycosyltransferase